MALIEADYNCMNWTQLAENRVHRLIIVNLQVSKLSSFDQLNNSNCPRDVLYKGNGSFRPTVQQVSTVIPQSSIVGGSETSNVSQDRFFP